LALGKRGRETTVHLDLWMSLAGLIVGVVVGLTGMGGGALMTPILVILFGVQPLAAVSSDLVAAVVMKPVGGGIHFRKGTVHFGLVRWLALGSVPSAFLGSYIISRVHVEDTIKTLLGAVLLVAAGAMLVKGLLGARRRGGLDGEAAAAVHVRRGATLAIGIVGGLIVGMTSVGSGSLIIVVLMMIYPKLAMKELVGTDLVQAVPLVLSAAIGHAIFGDLQLAITGSLLIGSIPGVIIGANLSARARDAYIRPVLVSVLALSALKLLDVSNGWLLFVAIASAVVTAGYYGVRATRRKLPERELTTVSGR
jgi:uncharacterized membrane protein YfcA